MMPIRTMRLRIPRTHRNTPDTDAPMTPVIECSSEESFSTCPASAFTPTESRKASMNTIVECPRENQKSTESGLRGLCVSALSDISLRVVLSTAAMWSASKACRSPKV